MSPVLLVHPNTNYQTIEFSLTLGTLGGALKEQGHRVSYRLLDLAWNQSWHPLDIPADTDLVGITVTSCHYDAAVTLAEQFQQSASPPLVVAGGAHATFDPESLLTHGFDVCVRGEGEETICQLAAGCQNSKKNGGWLAHIRGISYKNAFGEIIHNEDKAQVENLDTLPLPDWQQDEFNKVVEKNRLPSWDPTRHYFKDKPVKTFMIESSRGCPYKCVFCTTSKIKGKQWRGKSIERILAEFLHFKSFCLTTTGDSTKQPQRYLIQFPDDNFCYNSERVEEFCSRIMSLPAAERPWWTIMARANRMRDTGLVKRMKEAGCLRIYIGAECGYEAGLKRIKKGITLEMIEQAVNHCLTAEIPYIVLSWIIGFPWESRREALTTIYTALRFASLKPETIKISIFTFTPIVGADITEQIGCSLPGEAGDHERHNTLGFSHPLLKDQDLFELQMTAQWLNYLLNVKHNLSPEFANYIKELKEIRHLISQARMGMESDTMQHFFIQIQEFLNIHQQGSPDQLDRSIKREFPHWMQIVRQEIDEDGGFANQ